MRSTATVLLTLVLASGCFLDRSEIASDGGMAGRDAATDAGPDAGCGVEVCNGVDDDCDGVPDNGLGAVCNDDGDALEGCTMGVDRRTSCTLGCTRGADFCWECDPSDTTLTCNDAGTALEGCGADGRTNVDACLNGCTPGEAACAPCVDGTTACDGTELVTCVAGVEQRDTCAVTCIDMPAPACAECTPGASECQEGTESAAVQCGSDGTVTDRETCPLGCSLVSGVATCNECTPSTSRCNAAGNAVLSCNATGMQASTTCEGGTTCVQAGTSASCEGVCVPGCSGGTLTTCPGGTTEVCPLGCNTAGDGCGILFPSNVDDTVAMDAGTLALDVASDERLVFFANDGRILRLVGTTTLESVRDGVTGLNGGIFFESVAQGGENPDIAVWAVRSLNVAAGGAIYFVNGTTGSRVAALLVGNDATIAGRIDAGGGHSFPLVEDAAARGPGAGAGGPVDASGQGDGGGRTAINNNDGGGGGGFGTEGGRDGSNRDTGGAMYGSPALVPLVGGSGGGGSDDGNASGGAGGGAIQISVGGTLTIQSTGTVGSAGRPGRGATGHGGGGGGGSGGAVLLEARSIDLAGVVGVPGGGGGGGRHDPGSAGGIGVDWAPPGGALRCFGGAASTPNPGGDPGGFGGDGSDLNGVVGTAGNSRSDDGGGGGGAGRIRLNALSSPGDITITGTLRPVLTSSAVTRGTIAVR